MHSSSITLFAPAKINLSLRLLDKRADGYHEIETLMTPLALADELEISHTHAAAPGSIILTCNDPSLPTDEENLCVKAARAFQQASGLEASIAITLLKKIPHGAGLGGGSSDAAAVLCGMNQLFDEPLTHEELHQLAAALGSDVPFFLTRVFSKTEVPSMSSPAWCRGRGEILTDAPALPAWSFLLIKPPFPIATAWAYQAWEKKNSPVLAPIIIEGIELFNDLEAAVFEKYLLLPVLKKWLQHRAEVRAAWMSGSGSTMVALLERDLLADQIAFLKNEIQVAFGSSFQLMETRTRDHS